MRFRRLLVLVVTSLSTIYACTSGAVCHQAPKATDAPAAAASRPRVPDGWPFPLDSPAASGDRAMVVTDQPLATEAGVAVLRDGGNAIDAAVATAFALAVVLPSAGNIGGGGFLVALVDGRSYALAFREKPPGGSSRNMYLAANGDIDDRSVTGRLAAGVPGSVAGLFAAHQKLGSKRWADLVQPAIRLADEGFVVDEYAATVIKTEAARLARFPASAALYLPQGQPIEVGTRLKNPDLARTLRRIADRGRDGFYTGETAALIVAEMKRGNGIMTARDLEGYEPKWRKPIPFRYRGHEVISMPPPSSGGLTLALIAGQLSSDDLGALGWHTAKSVHLMAESMRRAFAVRNELLGDPDFVKVDQDQLLSPPFSAALRATISAEHATPSKEVSGRTALAESRQTTHFSIADEHGNAVGLTTTLNGWYGSAVTVPGAGFLLNDEMDDFASKPGSPNMFGLVQGEANAIAPGKRPLSSTTPTIALKDGKLFMPPTIVLKDGKLFMTAGAPGGSRISTAVAQVILNVLDFGMNVQDAVDAPRVHHQWQPDKLSLEHGVSPDPVALLKARGYDVDSARGVVLAQVAAIVSDGGWLQGASDGRSAAGKAAGY